VSAEIAGFLGAQFGAPLEELVVDFTRDTAGALWLLQVGTGYHGVHRVHILGCMGWTASL
jgi:hypothetical protein